MIEGKLQNDDVSLLCSDGLSGKVSAHNIELVLARSAETLSGKVDCLIQQALEVGGDDNITLILLEVCA